MPTNKNTIRAAVEPGTTVVLRQTITVPLYSWVSTNDGKGKTAIRSGERTVEVDLELDASSILKRLAGRAAYAKTGKSSGMDGAAVAKVIAKVDMANLPCPFCGNPPRSFSDGAWNCDQHGRIEQSYEDLLAARGGAR